MSEDALDPALPIVDAHHHLWDFGPILGALDGLQHPLLDLIRDVPRFLHDELMAELSGGHNVVATVMVECGAFYDAGAPQKFQPIGEIEHANGVAARSASGIYGPTRLCSAMVGYADLALGDEVIPVLERAAMAGGNRLRGIRIMAPYDEDPDVVGPMVPAVAGLYGSDEFRSGFAHLGRFDLSFDAWVLEPQLPEVEDLAKAFSDQPIVLNHVGTPLGIAGYAGKLTERFETWRESISRLAQLDNVSVKLSGLAMPYCAFPGLGMDTRPTSSQLAELWAPYIETCIEAFGPSRSMFASNFPVEKWGADYTTLWNAFKRIASAASDEEKAMLFSGTANQVYRIAQPAPQS
ncbi:amidohydrolase family protein [Croceicoccus sediminis]|uniref:amidohydrolase family protein n=1 Tax=Croceicoccus sediminis TaxID=2571150 RepID=UPI0011845D5A|nr:amidohydrolase family protein [Croceicoccus sediminis]